mmetsp:Transcript_26104/g.87729  ORF Transcript_26104/g.87729 Transcript_26104/m.87729 type:complete len:238 (-) Transcript_26104:340-1053(-)
MPTSWPSPTRRRHAEASSLRRYRASTRTRHRTTKASTRSASHAAHAAKRSHTAGFKGNSRVADGRGGLESAGLSSKRRSVCASIHAAAAEMHFGSHAPGSNVSSPGHKDLGVARRAVSASPTTWAPASECASTMAAPIQLSCCLNAAGACDPKKAPPIARGWQQPMKTWAKQRSAGQRKANCFSPPRPNSRLSAKARCARARTPSPNRLFRPAAASARCSKVVAHKSSSGSRGKPKV